MHAGRSWRTASRGASKFGAPVQSCRHPQSTLSAAPDGRSRKPRNMVLGSSGGGDLRIATGLPFPVVTGGARRATACRLVGLLPSSETPKFGSPRRPVLRPCNVRWIADHAVLRSERRKNAKSRPHGGLPCLDRDSMHV